MKIIIIIIDNGYIEAFFNYYFFAFISTVKWRDGVGGGTQQKVAGQS